MLKCLFELVSILAYCLYLGKGEIDIGQRVKNKNKELQMRTDLQIGDVAIKAKEYEPESVLTLAYEAWKKYK